MYLDPLNALGDDVGMVHGHQRDLDSGHPAHGAGPHSCGQSRERSALLCLEGRRWCQVGWGACAGTSVPGQFLYVIPRPLPAPPPQRKARLLPQPAWPPESQGTVLLTCTIDHAGRLDGAVLCLHGCDPPHPEVVGPHTDAGHGAVLDDLGARGAASRAMQGSPRVLTTPDVPPPRLDGTWGTVGEVGRPWRWKLAPGAP